jgi:hypothetical protein
LEAGNTLALGMRVIAKRVNVLLPNQPESANSKVGLRLDNIRTPLHGGENLIMCFEVHRKDE